MGYLWLDIEKQREHVKWVRRFPLDSEGPARMAGSASMTTSVMQLSLPPGTDLPKAEGPEGGRADLHKKPKARKAPANRDPFIIIVKAFASSLSLTILHHNSCENQKR